MARAEPPGRSGSQYEAEMEERRLEALEGALRGKIKAAGKATGPSGNSGAGNRSAGSSDTTVTRAKWREGQLLPTGWESMSLMQKVTELYLGERGMLFWANKVRAASMLLQRRWRCWVLRAHGASCPDAD